MKQALEQLGRQLTGELYHDVTMRTLYATDASAYREMPLAVAIPKTEEDIKQLIAFARANKTSLIPRTAGTSLAGQVVGNGIVVDVSKYFTQILELNADEKWVRVQPGVIRDELNMFLKPHGLFFGPETSTANRAMIGGMVGNNSCGSNSVVYRSTREHLLEVKALLSDGSEAVFKTVSIDEFHQKCEGDTLESRIYKTVRGLLSNYDNQEEIRKEFPKKSVERRNTGYAVDMLLETAPFTAGQPDFNFCSLIAGSEGTLAFLTEIKLNVVPLPPKEVGLLCVHFNTIDESLRANLIALKYKPSASELIDHYVLECTKNNREQVQNRFFVQGDPGAILVVEFTKETRDEIMTLAAAVEAEMRAAGLGYHFPLLFGADSKKIWTLRKAGLGLLSNLPGDDKAVPVIEDTAVDVEDLPAYIREFNEILKKHGLYSVHYAHAGSGELHLRPIINLKTEEGNRLFRVIAEEIATLVKKYNGSLSGEHGDGRLRGEFIRQMVGEKNYRLLKQIKEVWDPENIFNPNKIVDTPSMNSMLRYEPGQKTPVFKTVFRYHNQDVLQHAEQCNGSGDCRKSHLSGGTMCPSYMATRNEKDSTRARANILREYLTHSEKLNRFDHEEIKEVMDLCLSCKACKSECPSNVDMAKLKAEFLQQYYDTNGVPLRSRLIANFSRFSALGSIVPGLYNFVMTNRVVSKWVKNFAGFAPERSMPLLHDTTLKAWYKRHQRERMGGTGTQASSNQPGTPLTAGPKTTAASAGKSRLVYLFCDEFTNYNDTPIGIKTILLLERLGYEVIVPEHVESGRSRLSKGLIRDAKKIARKNISLLRPLISEETPLIGVEPSAILTFRDEYPDLAEDDQLEAAKALAQHVYMADEFIAREIAKGNISRDQFTKEKRVIKLHGHCQQKSLSSVAPSVQLLSLPENYTVETIASGCCGMAGSFGYEKEHYELSQKVGELVLLPAVRSAAPDTIIAAPGTSCRHQIKDGTGRKALHPVEVLYEALL
ncbi:FAD-binding and (Fe-S)-binding domain-containing protein [Flavihumibacter stibioxidans]|uniref:FAD-binding protein n=1 Tax=Flavihumibacter stibioxidans TaxID=1834163 RepID=A0ABR7MD56_9BACT|nr:FAD-binding and (Fe-S)-binding domain-containing protein [Flavihumibacter stibioxidans]MBC6492887.1 FAD-binding protein [Flavihumibacter stibioxidans]